MDVKKHEAQGALVHLAVYAQAADQQAKEMTIGSNSLATRAQAIHYPTTYYVVRPAAPFLHFRDMIFGKVLARQSLSLRYLPQHHQCVGAAAFAAISTAKSGMSVWQFWVLQRKLLQQIQRWPMARMPRPCHVWTASDTQS